jgi:hypothetical protein
MYLNMHYQPAPHQGLTTGRNLTHFPYTCCSHDRAAPSSFSHVLLVETLNILSRSVLIAHEQLQLVGVQKGAGFKRDTCSVGGLNFYR